MQEEPHRFHVTLTDGFQGRQLLKHKALREVVQLPAVPTGRYALHFDDEGAGFLTCGTSSKWISDIFTTTLLQEGGVCYVLKGDSVVTLDSHLGSHKEHMLTISLPASSVTSRAWVFKNNQGGGRLYWDIGSSYLVLQVGSSSPSSWYLHHWAAWEAYARRLGLQHVHIRKPVETRHASLHTGPRCPWHVQARGLPKPSLATAALLAVVGRLATPKNRSRNLKEVAAWSSFLRGLLQQCLPAAFTLALCLGSNVCCDWDLGITGTCITQLPCIDGMVDLSALTDKWGALLECCSPGKCEAPVVELFLLAHMLGVRFQPIFLQLVVCLAHHVEAHFLDTVAATGGPKKTISKKSLILQGKLVKSYREKLTQSSAEKLCRYFFAGRRHFRGSPNIGLAVDGSRVGMRSVLVGLCSMPDNVVMRAPPQAFRRTQTHNTWQTHVNLYGHR